MAWFERKQTVQEALTQTLNQALGRIMEAQAKNIEAMGSFLEKMTDLSMKRAASAIGQRSAQVRARRRGAQQAARQLRTCRLCANPMITNPTVAEILEHNNHQDLDQPGEEAQSKAETTDAN